jgi:hydrogenase-4 component B
MIAATLLTLTWLAPLLYGLLLLWRQDERLAVWGPATAVPALLTTIVVPLDTVLAYDWLLLAAQFKLDQTAKIFLLFTAVLWFLSALFAVGYMAKDPRRPQFFGFFLLAMAGNFGLIIAGDMLGYYLWFAVMSFASYGLVVHTGDQDARDAGQVYIILVIVGEVILFAGLALLYFGAGGVEIGDYSGLAFAALGQEPLTNFITLLLFVGFGIKAGVVLLHLWLPLAHPAAPIPASAVLSGAMIKAGLLGWLRFLYPLQDGMQWAEWVLILGLLTAFYGAVVGVSQTNPKAVLAYSSISQMGFIMVGVAAWLATGELAGAALTAVLLYAFHHALAKGALFLGVGFAGTGRAALVAMLLPALALAGLPLTSGAAAKAALKESAYLLPTSWPVETLLGLAAVGTTLLMARFLWLIWRGEPAAKRPPRLMWGSWAALLALTAVALFILPLAETAVADSLKLEKLWPSLWPILLGAGLAAAAARFFPRTISLPLIPPGDLVAPLGWLARRLTDYFCQLEQLIVAGEDRLWALVVRVAAVWPPFSGWLDRREYSLRHDMPIVGGILLVMALAIMATIFIYP